VKEDGERKEKDKEEKFKQKTKTFFDVHLPLLYSFTKMFNKKKKFFSQDTKPYVSATRKRKFITHCNTQKTRYDRV